MSQRVSAKIFQFLRKCKAAGRSDILKVNSLVASLTYFKFNFIHRNHDKMMVFVVPFDGSAHNVHGTNPFSLCGHHLFH